MSRARRRLPWFVCAWWMVFQCAFTAGAFASGAALPAGVACECPDAEPGAACPMHHAPSPADGAAALCAFTSQHGESPRTLPAGVGPAILQPPSALDGVDRVERVVTSLAPAATPIVPQQDPPPPRA